MEESVTYQAILAKGEARGEARGEIREAQKLVLRLGRKRWGPPDATTTAALAAITNLDRLEELSERLIDARSWEELLA